MEHSYKLFEFAFYSPEESEERMSKGVKRSEEETNTSDSVDLSEEPTLSKKKRKKLLRNPQKKFTGREKFEKCTKCGNPRVSYWIHLLDCCSNM